MSEDKNYVTIKDSDGNKKSLYFEKETLSILDSWLRKEYPFMGDLYRVDLVDLIKFAGYMTEKDNERESSVVENRARKNEVEYLKGFYEFAVDAYHESDCFPVEVFIEKELKDVAERYMDSRHYSAEANNDRLFDLSEDTAEKLGNLLDKTRENIKDYMAKTTPADSKCCCSESILEEAQRIVHGERQTDYADPVINFKRISDIASAVRGKDLDMLDCVTVQVATKLARQQNKHKRDNLVDLAGYAYIWHAIEEYLKQNKK